MSFEVVFLFFSPPVIPSLPPSQKKNSEKGSEGRLVESTQAGERLS